MSGGVLKSLRSLLPASSAGERAAGTELNAWQLAFCRWNAERLGLPEDAARQRFLRSWSAVRGGHSGKEYARFMETSHALYDVFHGENPGEIYGVYRQHELLHFLRFLANSVPVWPPEDPIRTALQGREQVGIVDYGCGLAHRSITLGQALARDGVRTHITLVDIPTVRVDFLRWLCADSGIACEFTPCSREVPFPALPEHDVCIATEVFEHIYEPLTAFESIHGRLRPGGFLVTNVNDHEERATHVSTDLGALRSRVRELGYQHLVENRILRKPAG